MMMLIDNDILIDHFHNNVAATAFIRQALLSGEALVISVASLAEILAGIRPEEEQDTEALLSLFRIYPADESVARTAGGYLNQYSQTHKLDLGDALVAATARSSGAILYTRNLRHYPMQDITVIAPYQRGG